MVLSYLKKRDASRERRISVVMSDLLKYESTTCTDISDSCRSSISTSNEGFEEKYSIESPSLTTNGRLNGLAESSPTSAGSKIRRRWSLLGPCTADDDAVERNDDSPNTPKLGLGHPKGRSTTKSPRSTLEDIMMSTPVKVKPACDQWCSALTVIDNTSSTKQSRIPRRWSLGASFGEDAVAAKSLGGTKSDKSVISFATGSVVVCSDSNKNGRVQANHQQCSSDDPGVSLVRSQAKRRSSLSSHLSAPSRFTTSIDSNSTKKAKSKRSASLASVTTNLLSPVQAKPNPKIDARSIDQKVKTKRRSSISSTSSHRSRPNGGEDDNNTQRRRSRTEGAATSKRGPSPSSSTAEAEEADLQQVTPSSKEGAVEPKGEVKSRRRSSLSSDHSRSSAKTAANDAKNDESSTASHSSRLRGSRSSKRRSSIDSGSTTRSHRSTRTSSVDSKKKTSRRKRVASSKSAKDRLLDSERSHRRSQAKHQRRASESTSATSASSSSAAAMDAGDDDELDDELKELISNSNLHNNGPSNKYNVEASFRECKLEGLLEAEKERNDELATKVSELEKKVVGLKLENEQVYRRMRQEVRDANRAIAEKDREIHELSETVDRILEAERNLDSPRGTAGVGRVAEAEFQAEIERLQAKLTTMETCLSHTRQMNIQLNAELTCYRDSSKSSAMKVVDDCLQKQNAELKAKMKFKDETIDHLMEQLKRAKQSNLSIDGSVHSRVSDMDTSSNNFIGMFSPGGRRAGGAQQQRRHSPLTAVAPLL